MTHFLDTFPFDWSRPQSGELLRSLLGAYPTQNEAEALIGSLAIDSFDIPWRDRMRLSWREIIQEARKRKQLRQLIDKVLADPSRAAVHDKLRALIQETPVVEPPAPRAPSGEPIVEDRWRGGTQQLERIIGSESLLVDVNFLERGLRASRAVARLAITADGESFTGTGFLIREDLLLTNHHCLFVERLGGYAKASGMVAWFNYQVDVDNKPTTVESVDGDVATIDGDPADDWAVIRLCKALDPSIYRPLGLEPTTTLVEGARVNIIQHPGGVLKKLSLIHNAVVHVDGRLVQYLTDTEPGSSGAPVFNENWEVVALHHSGGDLPIPGTSRVAFRNEGINIRSVQSALRARGLVK
jgi:Trypsin-like peptidase domain/Effector-associated domain 1